MIILILMSDVPHIEKKQKNIQFTQIQSAGYIVLHIAGLYQCCCCSKWTENQDIQIQFPKAEGVERWTWYLDLWNLVLYMYSSLFTQLKRIAMHQLTMKITKQ